VLLIAELENVFVHGRVWSIVICVVHLNGFAWQTRSSLSTYDEQLVLGPRCKPHWARVSLRTILFLSTLIRAVATIAAPESRSNWLICPRGSGYTTANSDHRSEQRSLSAAATIRSRLPVSIVVVRWVMLLGYGRCPEVWRYGSKVGDICRDWGATAQLSNSTSKLFAVMQFNVNETIERRKRPKATTNAFCTVSRLLFHALEWQWK